MGCGGVRTRSRPDGRVAENAPFGRRVHLVAAIPMAIAVVSFGAFTIIVAPFGDQYGI
jgi:hypothetical protein